MLMHFGTVSIFVFFRPTRSWVEVFEEPSGRVFVIGVPEVSSLRRDTTAVKVVRGMEPVRGRA